jgi:hypothetical protein
MTTILRWFHHEGRRFRAWFRTCADTRELVIASGDWEVCIRDVPAQSLDEMSDEILVALAATARRSGRDSPGTAHN